MNQFLRSVRQGRWHKYPQIDWLEAGELQGDALKDVLTRNGRLSVYRVANETDRQRVVVALAATKEHIENIDYAVFADSDLASLGITVLDVRGDTPDEVVNELHYELGNLTVKRLIRLVEIISFGEHKRVQRGEVEKQLQEAVRSGHLNNRRVKPKKIRELSQSATLGAR